MAHMSLLWGNVENSTIILRGGDSTSLNMRWGAEDKSSVDIYDHATSWGAPSKPSFLLSDMADASGAFICTPTTQCTVTLLLSTQMLVSTMFLFRDNSGSFDSKRSLQFSSLHCLHAWAKKKLNIGEHSSTGTIKVPSCTLLTDGERLLWIMDKTLNGNLLQDVLELYESIYIAEITDIDSGIERDGTHFLHQQVEATWISSLGHEDDFMQNLMEQQYACINDLDRVLRLQLMELLRRLIILLECHATLYASIKSFYANLRSNVANEGTEKGKENLIYETYQQKSRCHIAHGQP